MNLKNTPFVLNFDNKQLKARLQAPLSKQEIISLLVIFTLIFIFSYHHHQGYYEPWDFKRSYMPAGAGDYSNFFYAYWIIPIFYVLEKIPFFISYITWASLNVVCTFYAGRVFGGKSWLAILNYQMMYVIFYGQITGLLLGGLALAWWGMVNKKYKLAGLGFLIASTKPQFGVVLGFILLVMSGMSWKERIKVLLVPLFGFIVTFVAYPHWIQNIIIAIQNSKVDITGNISLWRYFGFWSLILLIPPLFFRLSTNNRTLLLIVASMFALPYFQQTGLLTLYVLPLGWFPLIGNLGFLFPIFGWEIIRGLFIVPLIIYFVIILRK